MKRVAVTGIDILSSLDNNYREVLESLENLKSDISFDENYRETGLRSHLAGNTKINTKERIDREILRFMDDAAAYAYITMKEAIAHTGLTRKQVSNIRTGIVTSSGGAFSSSQVEAADTLCASGMERIGPYGVTKCMASTVSACLATPFRIKGMNYSINSACSTSAHYIDYAVELIQFDKQDIMFAGDSEEISWQMGSLFDAMGALSSRHNDIPEQTSHTFDADRDGLVIFGGGSIPVMEEYGHAKVHGTSILCELIGYGATSDDYDMMQPSGGGAVCCMQMALVQHGGRVDYIDAHGIPTPVGDIKELGAVREAFTGQEIPFISSIKSLFDHVQDVAGSNEAIYSILMMQNDFVCASANIQNLDEQVEGLSILCENRGMELDAVMSSSSGFGSINAALIFSCAN